MSFKTLSRNIPSTLAALAWALAAGSGQAAATYTVQDYFYPMVQGKQWIYTNTTDGTALLRKIDSIAAVITCYSNRSHPQGYKVTAAAVYGDYGTWSGGSDFTSDGNRGDAWTDYLAPGSVWGLYGGNYYSSGAASQLRANPGFLVSSPLAVGQGITNSVDAYTNGVYEAPFSMVFTLLEVSPLTVPAGTFPNCLHVLNTSSGPGATGFTNEDWWAQGVGVIKRIRNGTPYELVNYSIRPPTLTLAIISPLNDEQFAGGIQATGTVTSSVALAGVFCQVGTNPWVQATGTTNWSAALAAAPGTNAVSVYAEDIYGDCSNTNSVNALIDSVFAIEITGRGMVHVTGGGIAGTLTNSGSGYLIPGESYDLTATPLPKSGFGFAGWTGSVTNTNAAITITMVTNMEVIATFLDIQPPACLIKSPADKAQVASATCTLTGTASDNVAVAAVYCQVGASAPIRATGSNTWTAAVPLAPGTNTVGAYAVDTSGNHSATNSLTVVGEVPFALQIAGQGTVRVVGPGYNRAFTSSASPWLFEGASYRLTAAPITGFGFGAWGVGATGTNSTVTVTIPPFWLTVTAEFVDTQPPTCVILYPAAAAKLTNEVIAVTGKARDNVGVTNVWCWLNGTNRLTAVSSNQWANWTAPGAQLALGTNLVSAYAADAAGNYSLTNTIRFTRRSP